MGALPVGDGEGDKGCVSVDLQDEGLQIGQLGSVRKPWLPIPANHCVCKAQTGLMGCPVCSMHSGLSWTSITLSMLAFVYLSFWVPHHPPNSTTNLDKPGCCMPGTYTEWTCTHVFVGQVTQSLRASLTLGLGTTHTQLLMYLPLHLGLCHK